MSRGTEPLVTRSPWIRVDPSTGAVRARLYRLKVVAGPDAGRSFTFTGQAVVGTSPSAQLTLSDPSVSHEHLELTARGGGVQVRDLGSTNGTFVASARVEEAFVEQDATLRVGRTALQLTVVDEEVRETAAPSSFGAAVGHSRAMQRLFSVLARLAPSDSPVVLTGETGTGKDVLARALHEQSPRRAGPFVVFDCGAVSPSVVESELFGHLKGAFTGASADRKGAFLQAHGGTLFLDEIGELPLELQPRLLRVLEAGTVRRVGEDTYRKVDVRILAATHRNLEDEVRAGRFRQDLYFRLAVAVVQVPPLRERLEDLTLLVKHFLRENGREDFELRPELMAKLEHYTWPGNVRELRNVVIRATLGEETGPETGTLGGPTPSAHFRPTAAPSLSSGAAMASTPAPVDLPFKEAKDRLVESFTRDYLDGILARHGGNVTRAAEAAGLARQYFHRLLVKYGLRTPGSDDDAP